MLTRQGIMSPEKAFVACGLVHSLQGQGEIFQTTFNPAVGLLQI